MNKDKQSSQFKIITKADILLGLSIIIISLLLTFFLIKNDAVGKYALVYENNELYGTYNLSENQTIKIKHQDHYNVLEIKNGNISMIEASCHNHICIKAGPINTTTDTIVCLPNKIFVTIISDDSATASDDSIDSISQ